MLLAQTLYLCVRSDLHLLIIISPIVIYVVIRKEQSALARVAMAACDVAKGATLALGVG